MKNIRRFRLSPSVQIILGFIILILIGTFCISLPISNKDGQWLNFIDSFFTSTSAVCVTGLVVVDTTMQFTLFGKFVILFLIQIGGLGIVALTSLIFLMLRKKISLNSRMALQESMNKDTIQGVVKFIKKTIVVTLAIEGVGALLLLYSTINFSGSFWKGLFYAVFMSVSSFCNAGFDVLGVEEGAQFSSLYYFANDVTMLLPIMMLILIGGIGFIVLLGGLKNIRNKQHTKVVLIMTTILLFGGAIIFLICEWNNPNTIGDMSFGGKVLNAFFQSVSPRTAGIAVLDQSSLTEMGRITTMALMLIGGSPNSTAGGLKTTTLFILIMFMFKLPNAKGDIKYKDKKISRKLLYKAIRLMMYTVLAIILAVSIIRVVDPSIAFESIVFECVSAISTVGLTMGITPMLSGVSKIVLIALMFIGRVGLTTLAMAISSRNINNSVTDEIEYPTTDIIV